MRIAVFGVRGVPSAYSGFETFLTEMLPQLAARGHQIEVFNRADIGSTKYRGLTMRHVAPPVHGAAETIAHGLRVVPLIDKRHFDVALAFNIANVPALAMLRVRGIPTILNTDGQEWERGKWGRTARAYWRLCARNAKHSANALISDSLTMQQIYRTKFNAASTLIPYCVRSHEPPAPRRTSFPFDKPYFLAAARVVPENQLSAIANAHLLSDCHQRLVILGKLVDGKPESMRLSKIAAGSQGRVVLGGHVSSPADFLSVVQNAELYLHGHTVGGINPSLIDAMSVAAHIAAFDTPFNREALGAQGRYWPDPAALSRLMSDLDSDQEAAGEARKDAHERAAAIFPAEEVAEAYDRLLATVTQNTKGTGVALTTVWERTLEQGSRDPGSNRHHISDRSG